MTQCVDLPQPLGPGRKWGTVYHVIHGMGFALHDEADIIFCHLKHLNKNSGLWSVWIHIKNPMSPWGSDRVIVNLGPHDSPPFEIAEAMADAVR
jgi:hypothetical protein